MRIHMARDVRQVIGERADGCTNTTLLMDRFPGLPDHDKDTKSRKQFLERLCRMTPDKTGQESRIRFLETEIQNGRRVRSFRAELRGRLIVNQAGGVIENAGLCLDRHFGCPYIPGSALKGLARMAARESVDDGCGTLTELLAVFGWGQSKEDRKILEEADIGEDIMRTSFAGMVSFLPAYPTDRAPLTLDIVNCHHPDYYSGKRAKALDNENPVPNIFPVVESGNEFVFTVVQRFQSGRMSWIHSHLGVTDDFNPVDAAYRWLLKAVTDHGAGAKTAAGYGWFYFDEEAEAQKRQEEEEKARREQERQLQEEEEARRLASMSPVDRAKEEIRRLEGGGFAQYAKSLSKKTPDERRAFAEILRTVKKKKWKTWKKKKPELSDSIRQAIREIGEELP